MERLKLDIQLFASTSGNLTTGANEDGTTFYLNWQQTTQGIDSQGRPYTRINWQIGINARYEYYSNAVQMGATTINGVQVHGGGTWSYIDSGTHQLANGSTTIYHNSNGTKTFSASISGWTIGCSWVNGSKSWELTRIPTASKVESVTFVLDAQNRPNNVEEDFNVVFTRYDSSFTDNLVIKYFNKLSANPGYEELRTITNYTSGDTISFTQTELTTLYNATPDDDIFTLKFQLATYSGETPIGTSDEFEKVVNIYDADPTFSGVTFRDTNSRTTPLTRNNQIIVKGYSDAELTIPVATGNKGATIVDYVIEGVDEPISHTGSELYYTIYGCTFGTFNVYARDSRGNTKLSTVIASSTKSYEKIYLNVSESKIERWENDSASATGNEAKLTLNGTIWNNNFGSEDNAITSSGYTLKITDSSGSPVAGTTDITPTINQDGTITFSDKIRSDNPDYSWNIGDSYYICVTVADRLSSATITLTLNSAIPTISLSKNGLGVMCDFDDSLGGYLQVNGQKVDPNASGIPNGSEFQFDGSTVPDGYEEVTDPHIYLTSEIKTNEVWINNKPIYRKVIEKTVNSNTTGTVDLSGLGYNVIWVNHEKSFNQYAGANTSSGVNWYNGTSDYGLVYINANKVLNIKNNSSSNRAYYVTIEYTKTTD